MTKMKNSGVEWIGEIPDDWEVSRVKNFLSERTGGAWGDEKKNNANDIICLRIADFDYSSFKFNNSTELTIRNYNTDIIEKLLLKKDDILVEKSGGGDKTPVGRAVIFEKTYKALFANFMDRLRVRNNISALFFLYVWTTYYDNKYMLPYVKQTTGIQNLDITSILSGVFFPLPPKSTQLRIASYLDKKCSKIEETIQNQQQVIEKLKAYKQSLINEAVTGKIKIQNGKVCGKYESYKDSGVEWIGKIPKGWEIPKIQYISTISSGTTPNRSQPKYWNGDVNWIKTGELQNNRLFEVEEKITQTAVEECSLQILPLNTVLIAMYGQGKTRGMTALLKTPSTTNQACAALIVNSKKLSSDFLWHCLIGAYNAIRADAEGSGQPNLNSENIKKFHITLPSSIEEQEYICNYLDKKCTAIDTAIEQKQNLIEKLTEYKKSLIYECVTGKKEC